MKYKVEAILIQADLSKDADVQKVIDHIFHIDAIVYSSGIAPYHLFVDVDDETIETMLQLHIKSPMKLVRTLLPKLMRNQTSHIILISSIWGQTGAACEVLYSTVKGAQIALVKALSKEVARNGVFVNAVAPGAVKTNMLASFSDEDLKDLEEDIPIGRLAKPEEIAQTISFLLSNKASYITGQVLAVNGGWYT